MARQQIVLQAVPQLAQNVNFKVDAYTQREKKVCYSFENKKTLCSPLYHLHYSMKVSCTQTAGYRLPQCYLINHTGQLSHSHTCVSIGK